MEVGVRLLGAPEAYADGAWLPLAPTRPHAALAYLAVHGGRVRRGEVAAVLWPDADTRSAQTGLRQVLMRLDRGPFGALVGRDRLGLWLLCKSDVVEFRKAIAELRWADAVTLHGGTLLDGFEIDDADEFTTWLSGQRTRVAEDWGRACRALLAAALEEGRYDDAERYADLLVRADPFDEQAVREAMRAAAAMGDQRGVERRYEALAERLERETGLVPGDETQALWARLRSAGDAHAGPQPATPVAIWPGLTPPAATETSFFAGREPELGRLGDALHRVASEGVQTVFVVGEAGSGKTELLAEFARRAQEEDPGLLVLWGHSSAFTGRGDPFEPFVHATRMLCGEAEAPPQARAGREEQARRAWQRLPDTIDALLEQGPELLGRFVTTPSLRRFAHRHAGVPEERLARLDALAQRVPRSPPERATDPAALFEQYTTVLHHLARCQRMLVLLDDLQWSDPGSVDLLFHLARGLGTARVLLVGAYRPEHVATDDGSRPHPLAGAVGELLSAGQAEHIDLADAADAAFVDAVLDNEPNALGPSFRSRLTAHTGGHALFTIELLRAMQARGDLRVDPLGRWVEGPGLRWDELPARVEAAIATRIGNLSAACVEALEVASIEGEEFTAEVVAAVTGRPLPEISNLLSREAGRHHRWVVAQAVRPVADGGLGIYRFRHGLFASYLRRHLDPVERARLHGRVARELERLYRRDLRHHPKIHHALARHFDAAGLAQEAVTQYVAAAAHARHLSAHASAVDHLQRALELLKGLPESRERDAQELRMHLALGTTVTAAQGWAPPALEAVYARARALAERVDDVVQVLPALWQLQLFHLGRAEHDLSDRAHERLCALAARIEDPVVRDQMRMTVLPFFRGRFAEARRIFESVASDGDVARQRALAERFGLASAPVAQAYLAECLWLLGEPDAADRLEAEARELACAVDHPMTTGTVFARACWRAAFGGDHAATGARAADLLRVVREHDLGNYLLTGTFFSELAARGRPAADRLERLADAMERYRQSGTLLGRSAFLTLFARACVEEGQPERGVAAVNAALAASAASGERWVDAEAWRTKADLLEMRTTGAGHDERTHRAIGACLRTALRIAEVQGATTLARRAEAALQRHQPTKARTRLSASSAR
jgi:DNA-binding SARP family transcriptional activator